MNEEIFGNPDRIDFNKMFANSDNDSYIRRRTFSENKLPSLDKRQNLNCSMRDEEN